MMPANARAEGTRRRVMYAFVGECTECLRGDNDQGGQIYIFSEGASQD